MTKESLAAMIYRYHGGLSKSEAHKIIETILERMKEKLKSREKVQIIGFGSIEVVLRKGRRGKNPLTGKDFYIEERRSVRFKPSRKLIEKIN